MQTVSAGTGAGQADTTAGVGPAEPLEPEDKGAAAVEAFARGHEELTEQDERDALDFLLAPKPPRLYGVTVQYDTERGLLPLMFVIRALDGRKLDAIEQSCVSDSTGKLDAITMNCMLVAEACVELRTPNGHTVALTSEKYLTMRIPDRDAPEGVREQRLASPADALEARFKTQLGLLAGVTAQLRAISGYDPQRVGSAQRRLAAAVGNS